MIQNLKLAVAARRLLDMYVALANSGDCGSWNPEAEDEVIALRQALEPYADAFVTPAREHVGRRFCFVDDDTLYRVVEVEGSSYLYYAAEDPPYTVRRLDDYIILEEEES